MNVAKTQLHDGPVRKKQAKISSVSTCTDQGATEARVSKIPRSDNRQEPKMEDAY